MVQIKVFGMNGNTLATLVNENKTTGNYSVQWDAANQPSGIYTYVLMVNGKQLNKKALKVN